MGRAFAARIGVTPAEERAFAGVMPALFEFLGIAQQTPGLSELLWRTLDLPSALSIVRNLGVRDVSFAFQGRETTRLDPRAWNLSAEKTAYLLPLDLKLNGHPSLVVKMVVTAPQPPRLVSGGIVAMVAESPSKPDKFVTFHLLSATRGAEVPAHGSH